MSYRVLLPDELQVLRQTHWYGSDFQSDQDTAEWVITATDSGSGTVGDAVGGVLALVPSDGTVADNDETYAESPNETFLFAADKPFEFEARVQFTEANADDANIFVGLVDGVAANLLVDDGAGPKTTASGCGFFKVDGGTVWKVWSSKSTTQTTTTTVHTAGGSSYQTLQIKGEMINSTTLRVTYFIDGVQCLDTSNKPIYHTVTVTSATEMQIGLGVKNGGSNLETLNVDYVFCAQKR